VEGGRNLIVFSTEKKKKNNTGFKNPRHHLLAPGEKRKVISVVVWRKGREKSRSFQDRSENEEAEIDFRGECKKRDSSTSLCRGRRRETSYAWKEEGRLPIFSSRWKERKKGGPSKTGKKSVLDIARGRERDGGRDRLPGALRSDQKKESNCFVDRE